MPRAFRAKRILNSIVSEAQEIVNRALDVSKRSHERLSARAIAARRHAAACHLASLPYGIGDVGPAALAWVDRLREPARAGGKPCRSVPLATATRLISLCPPLPAMGYSISPDWLIEDGLIARE